MAHGEYNKLSLGKYGNILYNQYDEWVGKSLDAYGEYSQGEIDLFAQFLQEGDYVIEAGSNIGAHTLPLARLVGPQGHVYAFEPQRLAFQTVCANMALNSLMNVDIFQEGVSNKNKTITIKEIDYNQAYNFGGFSIDAFKGGHTPLNLCRLDDKLGHIPRLKLIKMDIEGMELKALKGAKRLIQTFKPLLYIENDKIDNSPKLLSWLFKQKYRVFWHFPYLFNPKNFNQNTQCVFPREDTLSSNILCIHQNYTINIDLQEATDPNEHPLEEILRTKA